jgi:hypothetical protein
MLLRHLGRGCYANLEFMGLENLTGSSGRAQPVAPTLILQRPCTHHSFLRLKLRKAAMALIMAAISELLNQVEHVSW